MPIIDYREVLKGVVVREAMRRQVISLSKETPLEQAIRFTIKYKVNAILIMDENQEGLGVVSKTDLMGAYYSGLPLGTPCGEVMMGPPLFVDHKILSTSPWTSCGTRRFIASTSGRVAPLRPWASWPIRISWVCFTAIVINASVA